MALLLVLLAVAACSDGGDGGGAASERPGTTSPPRPTEAPWVLAAVEGDRLQIVYGAAGCEEFDHVEVDEGPAAVAVRLYVRHADLPEGTPCTGELAVTNTSVVLETPLGERRLTGECDPDAEGGAGRICEILRQDVST